jgi:aminoglycoside 3-N-acetyltransferase
MRRALESAVRRHAPAAARPALRSGKRAVYRTRYRLRRLVGASVDRSELAAGLEAAGLSRADGVFVHSALSGLGHVDGGPATVIGAFEDVLGADGLIAMPAFPLVGGSAEYLASDPVFDVRSTPSRMGAVTEHFRRLPGVRRSLHPTHSVCARGPRAEELVRGHADASTPFGEGTPFARLIDRGAYQVWLGLGIEIFTLYHAFECLREGGYPIDVFHTQPVSARVVDEGGRERVVTTLVHDPAVATRKVASRAHMRRHLERTGVLETVRVGDGEILCARMPDLLDELETLLREGITIYDRRLLPARVR